MATWGPNFANWDWAEIWYEVREPLVMRFKQTKGRLQEPLARAPARASGSFSFPFPYLGNSKTLCAEIWCRHGYGSTSYAFHASYEWGTLRVLMCAPLFVSREPLGASCSNVVCCYLLVTSINHAFDTGHKWMISTGAQVQPNILLKAHLFAFSRLSPKRRLTGRDTIFFSKFHYQHCTAPQKYE